MLSWAAFAGAAALACWPGNPSADRLAPLLRQLTAPAALLARRPRQLLPLGLFTPITITVALVPVLGAGVVGALVLLALAVRAHRVAARRGSAQVRATAELAEAVRAVVAALRAGAHPAEAAASVAADGVSAAPTPPAGLEARQVLRELAATERLGVPADAVGPPGRVDPGTGQAVHRLRRAWALAQRHGLPLAEVLESVRRDLDAVARFTGQLDSRLAGARASAVVLALLPLFGLVLGEVMGAHPVRFLLGTAAGQVLCVLGAGLILGGVVWTARLTTRAVVL